MKNITVDADFSAGPPKYNSQISFDRSSFVPFKQRPAVDSLIRELSIRDKKKNNKRKEVEITTSNFPQKVSTAGQFDTTHFGQGSALVEEEEMNQETPDTGSPKVARHLITCSMSSDEESSDEEVTELARKINRAGTVARFLKNQENNRNKGAGNFAAKEITVQSPEDEEGMYRWD